MRHDPLPPSLFVENRSRLRQAMKPGTLAIVHSNDIPPTNADGTLRLVQNSDLFYLSGVDQEESILLLFPDADDEKHREILFLRETSELIAIWEGHKLTKEEARQRTGIQNIQWLSEFPNLFRRLMCETNGVYLNSNEHKRAIVDVESRDARFIRQVQRDFPLHDYHRLAQLMHRLRVVKSDAEISILQKACDLTDRAFRRVAQFTCPGVTELEIEAEFIHEFTRGGGRFAYTPIIASGANACVLHYIENDQPCRDGDLLLLDVASAYANYNADLTRTIPVNGRFSRRQRQVYNSVLKVLRASMKLAVPGKRPKEWQAESEALITAELLELGLLKTRDIRRQDPDRPAFKKYFMHGVGHPLGLDVHDVGHTTEPMQAGWVMTCEPAIYIREEGFAVRLENDFVVTPSGPRDLMGHIPIEAEEIESLMARRRKR